MEGIRELRFFYRRVKYQRIKKHREQSRTAVREELIKLAQYLREEKEGYEPIEGVLL